MVLYTRKDFVDTLVVVLEELYMPEFPRSDFRLHIGWRNIKTSVTAMLVAMAYCLIGRNPAFTDKSIRKILYETRNFFRAKMAPKRFRVFDFSQFPCAGCYRISSTVSFCPPRLFSTRTVHVTIEIKNESRE